MTSSPSTSTPATFTPTPNDGPTLLGHPMGLFLLFLVEMWERFSYYGMRALLVLYLTSPMSGMREPPPGAPAGFNPGPGWSDGAAATLAGWYTGLAYLTPLIGGIIADKLIGTHRSMLVGGVLIMLGHVALGVSGLGGLNNTPTGMSVFIGGLALIVLGTGHFKPSVSVMVGQLYPPGDPRRDGAFSIFYMGINLGAFLCAFVCGTLGEKVGWHWGFGSAAVGMFLGLALYIGCKPLYLRGIGDAPASGSGRGARLAPVFLVASMALALAFGLLYASGALAAVAQAMSYLSSRPILGWSVVGALVAGVLAWIGWFLSINRREDRGPVLTIFIYTLFNAFFWVAFEQAATSINLFTDRNTDRMIGSFQIPTTWFQSVNSAFIILLAPVFAWVWVALGRRRMNPSQPVKIAMGLLLVAAGYIIITLGAKGVVGSTEAAPLKVGFMVIVGTYFMHTLGELCLSPTGLSYVTKAAPVKFVSLLMGVYFVSSFLANLGAGLIASTVEDIEKGAVKLPWQRFISLGGQADFFLLFVIVPGAAGLLIWALSPWLKRMQRSPQD